MNDLTNVVSVTFCTNVCSSCFEKLASRPYETFISINIVSIHGGAINIQTGADRSESAL